MPNNLDFIEKLASKMAVVQNELAQFKQKGTINSIDIDWLKFKLLEMYDVLASHSLLNENEADKKPLTEKESEQNIESEDKGLAFEPETQNPGSIIEELIQYKTDVSENQNNVNFDMVNTNPQDLIKTSDNRILAEKFKTKSKSIHEVVAGSTDKQKDVYDKLKSGVVKNISQAIGYNERYLFIKELFQGNTAAFQNAINDLEKAENLEQLNQYILENFSWDVSNETANLFRSILERRLGEK